MKTYFDTGVLLKVYIQEPLSELADAMVFAAGTPIPLTHFHEIELRTALRVKFGRGEITAAELDSAIKNFQIDISSGRFLKPAYELVSVFHQAEKLSAEHATETLARSLDILHVASALVLKVGEFVSFDERQRKMAQLSGLKVSPEIIS